MNLLQKPIVRVLVSLVVISLSAQITIDIGDIPITGQTLAILVCAILIKPFEIFAVMVAYLGFAAMGTPILAKGASGIEKMMGPSAGYLIGFVIASVLISYLFRKINRDDLPTILALTALGTALIVIFGVARLSMIYGLTKGIEYGFTPFWAGAILKILIGSSIVYAVNKWQTSK